MTNNGRMALGGAIAILTSLWWYYEVAGRLGRIAFQTTFTCLAKVGAGDCTALWFVGLHQENQIAGVVFWIGVALGISGLWRKHAEAEDDFGPGPSN